MKDDALEVAGRLRASREVDKLLRLKHRAEGLVARRPGALGLAQGEVRERGADVGHQRALERVVRVVGGQGVGRREGRVGVLRRRDCGVDVVAAEVEGGDRVAGLSDAV